MLTGDPLASARQAQAAHTLHEAFAAIFLVKSGPTKAATSWCSALLSAYVWAAVVSRGGYEYSRRPLLGHRHLTT